MIDEHKEKVIQVALDEYRNSITFGFGRNTVHAISMMEEALHMCSPYNIKGVAELEDTIKQAKRQWSSQIKEHMESCVTLHDDMLDYECNIERNTESLSNIRLKMYKDKNPDHLKNALPVLDEIIQEAERYKDWILEQVEEK